MYSKFYKPWSLTSIIDNRLHPEKLITAGSSLFKLTNCRKPPFRCMKMSYSQNHSGVPTISNLDFLRSNETHTNSPNKKPRLHAEGINRMERQRAWQKTAFGYNYKQNETDIIFTVMTYNVLAQNLVFENRHLYPHCHDRMLSWNCRSSLILAEIDELQPDILCLQEVQAEHFETFYQPKLSLLGYNGIFKKRTGDKKDGCALFYMSKFTLTQKTEVEFYRPNVPLMDRDNVGIVAILETKDASTKSKFCVATTHLLFNPKREDIRLMQLSMLLAEIDKLAKTDSENANNTSCPVILCGDFNTQPYTPLYFFAADAQWDSVSRQPAKNRRKSREFSVQSLPFSSLGISKNCQYLNEDTPKCSTVSHPFNFLSVYKHMKTNQSSASSKFISEITTHHDLACVTVDYIFYTIDDKRRILNNDSCKYTDIKESSLKLHSRLSLLSEDEIKHFGGLPNQHLGSDHLSLMAKFVLNG